MTEYLSLDSVVAINEVHCGAGSGVRDREGLEGAIGRPSSGSFDHEFFPDLWTKAAAYLHGLSSTQYFHDGNKRTAWLAATVFLRVNGVRVPHVPDVESEAFVLAVAKDLFRTSDEPDRTIEMAAEWFRTRCEPSRADNPISWSLESSESSMVITGAFFADYVRISEGKLDVLGGVWDTYGVPSLPRSIPVDLVLIAQTGHDDVGRLRHVDIDLVRPGSEPEPLLALDVQIDTAENRFYVVKHSVPIRDPGRHVFRITVEGNTLAARTVSLDIRQLEQLSQ
ncbi:type II toxin-antitoxin system death-on-curing family toxin [Rhodococcus opacus]|uniref:type II toxin-antitoxin system death-on-curing family toxin n=1 Tax=Rhodococcus opacus TaxID=37919 RepID=UPI0013005B03|nr:Fic family protein [Rhodococcus opacus]